MHQNVFRRRGGIHTSSSELPPWPPWPHFAWEEREDGDSIPAKGWRPCCAGAIQGCYRQLHNISQKFQAHIDPALPHFWGFILQMYTGTSEKLLACKSKAWKPSTLPSQAGNELWHRHAWMPHGSGRMRELIGYWYGTISKIYCWMEKKQSIESWVQVTFVLKGEKMWIYLSYMLIFS